jgi:hypothetical protein
LTGINKYNQHLKLSNLEIAGAPIDGRSGGGLFNSQGELIGVCNAADYDDDIGIYAGPGEIQWQLTQVGLRPEMLAASGQSDLAAGQDVIRQVAATENVASALPQSLDEDQEVIVIVRSRTNPAAEARVVTFNQAPPQLMQLLQTPATR